MALVSCPENGASPLFIVCEFVIKKVSTFSQYNNRANIFSRVSEGTTGYFVRAGSSKLYRGGSLHKLTKIHAYNGTAYEYSELNVPYHDIALFEIRPPFRFSSTVRAARLPRESSKPPRTLYVCGWGHTNNRSVVSIFLSDRHARWFPV